MDRQLLINNIVGTINAAKLYDMPIVLSTVNVKTGLNQETIPQVKKHLRGVRSFDKTTINSWEDKEFDILFDEGVAHGRKLDEAGVSTTLTEYKGFIHDYGMLNPLSHIPAVQEALTQAAAVLHEALFGN